jgi:DNA-binding NtrC family response regulator
MKTRGTILLVDDEDYVRDSLATVLERRGYLVRGAASAAEALQSHSLDGIDVVVTDLRMPGEDGLQLVRRLAEIDPSLPVIVLTGHGTVPSAVEAMKSGAFEYVVKPVEAEEIVLLLDRAAAQSNLKREVDYLRSSEGGREPGTRGPLGVSTAWKQVTQIVDIAAPTDTSVLLLGESGTGKEEVAQLIHRRSSRSEGAFVRVNCAAIPTELFESEFFGHRKGAFTGAVSDRVGRFRVAHRGTLFLDEINSLPPIAQAKVLRVLQDGSFERVGDSLPTTVDVRLICASNADLAVEVDAGRFRPDLYYRINVMTIHMPPLRERVADIPVLARAFVDEFSSRLGKNVRDMEPDVLEALCVYRWPGNVRELRNVIERGVLLESTTTLRLASLPGDLARARTMPMTNSHPIDQANQNSSNKPLTLRAGLAAEERRILEEALRRSNSVRREAARILGIDERNLSYFLKKHGIGFRRSPGLVSLCGEAGKKKETYRCAPCGNSPRRRGRSLFLGRPQVFHGSRSASRGNAIDAGCARISSALRSCPAISNGR